MAVKYEIHLLKNASGTGQDRRFVRIHHEQPLTEDQLEEAVEHNCTATKADVKSILTAVRHIAEEQLANGNRFYLPGIGWFAVSASLSKQAQQPDHKVTGKDIFPTGIQFQPEDEFYQKATQGMTFHQSPFTSKSKSYDESAIWQLISDHIDQHGFITQHQLQDLSGLSRYMATKWLTYFVEEKQTLHEKIMRRQRLYIKE